MIESRLGMNLAGAAVDMGRLREGGGKCA